MKGNLTPSPTSPAPYPPRMADEPAVTADLEALVQRPFVKSLMDRVMAFQEDEYGGVVKVDWQAGTYYTGVFAAYLATREAGFREAAVRWGEAAGWKVGPRPFYADDLCIGQTMLDLYLDDPNPVYVEDLVSVLKSYFGKEVLSADDVHSHHGEHDMRPMRGRSLWWWCDALYMAPPVLARMHAATGEQRYLDLLHELYWDSCDFLYDENSCLFFRDVDFFPEDRSTTPEGKKRFWSRGNGWVYAGLVRVLDYLPESDPQRVRYLELFRNLTRKLVTLQKPDGLWCSWLNRPDLEQSPEVSGSSFFTYGLLAGIRRGWLDSKCYLPLALRAWRGLTAKLGTDGRLGFAQLVDSAPGPVRPESSIDYTHGAFLLVASELYTLDLGLADLRALEPVRQPKLMMENASWTGLKGGRAVNADSHIYLGGVDSAGNVMFHAYRVDPANAASIIQESHCLAAGVACDDRMHPAFLRYDDQLLAIYSGAGCESSWSWRRAAIPKSLPDWGPMRICWSEGKPIVGGASPELGSGLARLSAENGRIFHFFGPLLTWSDNGAETWREVSTLLNGQERSWSVKCADNGTNRIDVVFTDGVEIRHMIYQNGAFHSSDEKVLRLLEMVSGNPIGPEDATLIHCGGRGIVIEDVGYDSNSRPVVVFRMVGVNGDWEYWMAKWGGRAARWDVVRFAFAGCRRTDPNFAGGVTLDPQSEGIVYLSTNVDPATGEPNATGRYQIFRGTLDGDIEWEQLTFDARRDNIRPFVPQAIGQRDCVLWLRGTHRSHSDYQMDIYGIVDAGPARNSEQTVLGVHEAEGDGSPESDYGDTTVKPQVASRLREAV
jgi:rhamnogalacturonyl hydrolase YesR